RRHPPPASWGTTLPATPRQSARFDGGFCSENLPSLCTGWSRRAARRRYDSGRDEGTDMATRFDRIAPALLQKLNDLADALALLRVAMRVAPGLVERRQRRVDELHAELAEFVGRHATYRKGAFGSRQRARRLQDRERDRPRRAA